MFTPTQRLFLTIAILIALAGCASPERSALHSVENHAPAKPAGVYEMREVDVAPQVRMPQAPRYPIELKRAGIAGETVVMFTVKADGTVADATVLTATDARFGAAGRDEILKWRFKPAVFKGSPVDCRMAQKLVFTPVNS